METFSIKGGTLEYFDETHTYLYDGLMFFFLASSENVTSDPFVSIMLFIVTVLYFLMRIFVRYFVQIITLIT